MFSACGSCAAVKSWSWKYAWKSRDAPHDAYAGIRRGPDANHACGAAFDARVRRGRRLAGGWRAGLSAGPVPPLSGADVVLLADEELLEETALSVSEEGTQSLLLLSEDEGTAYRLRTLSLRGWGFVPPDAPSEELGAAVVAVAQGLTVLPKTLAERLLDEPAAAVEELSEPLTA